MTPIPQTQQEETLAYTPKGNHTLQIDRRRHTVITGVTDVCSFLETEIVLKLDGGVMVLTGQNFHIAKLLLEEGRLDVEGHVDSVIYETPRKAVKLSFPWFRRKT